MGADWRGLRDANVKPIDPSQEGVRLARLHRGGESCRSLNNCALRSFRLGAGVVLSRSSTSIAGAGWLGILPWSGSV